jgi:hypothetical protein
MAHNNCKIRYLTLPKIELLYQPIVPRSSLSAESSKIYKTDKSGHRCIVPEVVGLKSQRHKSGRGPDPLLDVEPFLKPPDPLSLPGRAFPPWA